MRFFKRPQMPAIFRDFQDFRAVAPPDFEVNFLGGLTRPEFCDVRTAATVLPASGEELFEFKSILEAAQAAGPCFTFVELGAGFGRWSCVAALAARRLAKDYRLHMAEAEPQHLEWIPMHMADNDISPAKYSIFPFAVGEAGTIPFYVEGPSTLGAANARDWYGQSAVHAEYRDQLVEADGAYFGRPMKALSNGFYSIDVESRPLLDMIAGIDFIDLIDMDIQGSEADVIPASIDFLKARVRRMHVETHSAEIEARLRALLIEQGWTIIHDFPQATKNVPTPYGPADFIGGLIDCVNPRV
jgi:FkbM family methyltransferase